MRAEALVNSQRRKQAALGMAGMTPVDIEAKEMGLLYHGRRVEGHTPRNAIGSESNDLI